MVLVAGATGLVGSQVCELLRQQGKPVRALVRPTSSPDNKAHFAQLGVELAEGDLKDSGSLRRACKGVTAVVSTASATLARQDGDSLHSVDYLGQLSLVEAAEAAGVIQFVYVSFRNNPDLSFPLRTAKTAVEERLRASALAYTILQASYFMEVWLSPALGFDYASRAATVFGDGASRTSWVSSADVAQAIVTALDEPLARRQTIGFGGPQALSMLEVVRCFEALSGGFQLQFVPSETLKAAFDAAEDPLQKTFAALQLQCALGDEVDPRLARELLPIPLTSVEQYAARVTAS